MGNLTDATYVPSIDPKPRLAILKALPPYDGEFTKAMTITVLGGILGKNASGIHQMLMALRVDGLVDHGDRDGKRQWWRTAVPVPEVFTSTAYPKEEGHRFDDSALREALGVPLAPRPKAPMRLVRLCGKPRCGRAARPVA